MRLMAVQKASASYIEFARQRRHRRESLTSAPAKIVVELPWSIDMQQEANSALHAEGAAGAG